jgi:phosphomannomutase
MTFDALLTLGLILEMLARDGHPLSAEAESLPRFHMRKGEVRCEPARGYRVQEQFRLAYPEYDPKCSDGVRVDWDDAWLHVRVSNTEPILRAIVEADTQRRASALFEEAMNLAHSSSLEGERD